LFFLSAGTIICQSLTCITVDRRYPWAPTSTSPWGLDSSLVTTLTAVLHSIFGFTNIYSGRTMVEQNAKKGLEFADVGYVLVSGELAIAGPGDELLENPEVGRLFLGG